MISIIVPAHNEERVIGRCLRALAEGLERDEIEIIIACNGCQDRTAEVARSVDPRIRVLETPTASKTAALNLGDAAARGFPRVYLDADVCMAMRDIRLLCGSLSATGLAASPAVRMEFEGASWAVRAFYAVWLNLPYVREGLCGVGVYALGKDGRRRFESFPDVINDDGYVRALFSVDERPVVPECHSIVAAPQTLRGLIRIMTRSRLGIYQLRARFPELMNRETGSKSYTSAISELLVRPRLWSAAAVYLYVNTVTRLRARRQLASERAYVWERDDSARERTRRD